VQILKTAGFGVNAFIIVNRLSGLFKKIARRRNELLVATVSR
jgi:hypothetical protein